MNSIFSLYRNPREIGRLTAGAMLEYLIKGWGVAGAATVVIGSGETLTQKTYEACSGIPGIIVNAKRLWYALQHQDEIRRALTYMHEHMPSIEHVQKLGAETQLVYNKISQVLVNIELGLAQLRQTSILQPRATFDHAAQAQAHFTSAYELAPNLPQVKQMMAVVQTGSEALVQTYAFLQQVDYKRIHSTLNNVADNLQADEILLTVGIAIAAFSFAYVLGTIVGARTTRGVSGILSRFRQDWGARRFPEWYKKNIRRVLGDNLYKAAREHVEEDLRAHGKLKN
jgi:hypothetical protein